MKLLIFNTGYAKGWTSPLSYLKLKNFTGKIDDFLRRIKPDAAGLVEIKLKQAETLKKRFKYSKASCKYHPYLHKIPIIKCNGNAILSNTKCTIKTHYLKSGTKKLVLDCQFPQLRLLLVHLSLLSKNSRKKQIEELAKIAQKKTIVAGDFNIRSSEELNPLRKKGFKDIVTGPTFPSWNPKKHFDHVLISKDLKATAKILKSKLSDHLPILVNVQP